MSDLQLVENANKLITATFTHDLPRHHTLVDVWRSSRVLRDAGVALIKQYGERLEKLEPSAYRTLSEWEDLPI